MALVYWKCRNCGVYLPGEKLILNHHKYWKHDKKPKNHFHPEKDRDEWERMEFRELKVTLKSPVDENISDLDSEEDYDPNEDFEQEELQTSEEDSDNLPDKESFTCERCFVRIKYSRNLNRHMRMVHGIKKRRIKIKPGIKCKCCPFRTKSSIALAAHTKKFHLEKEQDVKSAPEITLFQKQEFQCYDCPSTFPNQRKLFWHRKKDHAGETPYECPHCPEVVFRRETSFKIHMLRHSDKWEELKKDPKLLKAERRKIVNERRRFRMSMYNKPLNFKCPHCPKAFDCNETLQNHIRSWHTKERPFKCTTCGASYLTKQGLDEHIKLKRCEKVIAETAAKIFPCHLCPVKLKTKRYLAVHMRKQHGISNNKSRIQPELICHFCGYRTKGSKALERHMKTHTGERDVPCEACGARFTCSSNMLRHVQSSCDLAKKSGLAAKYTLRKKPKSTIATKKYKCDPVKCPECNELLRSPGKFHNHKAIHGTAFMCPHCPAGYQKKMGLSFHLRRSHPENVPGEECESCRKKFGNLNLLEKHCQQVHEVNISSEREPEESPEVSENEEDFVESDGGDGSVHVKLEFESENEDSKYENILGELGDEGCPPNNDGKSRSHLEYEVKSEDFFDERIDVKVEEELTEEDYQDMNF